MLGLNNECPANPKPDLILEIDESHECENEELVEDIEQAVDDVSESDDSE